MPPQIKFVISDTAALNISVKRFTRNYLNQCVSDISQHVKSAIVLTNVDVTLFANLWQTGKPIYHRILITLPLGTTDYHINSNPMGIADVKTDPYIIKKNDVGTNDYYLPLITDSNGQAIIDRDIIETDIAKTTINNGISTPKIGYNFGDNGYIIGYITQSGKTSLLDGQNEGSLPFRFTAKLQYSTTNDYGASANWIDYKQSTVSTSYVYATNGANSELHPLTTIYMNPNSQISCPELFNSGSSSVLYSKTSTIYISINGTDYASIPVDDGGGNAINNVDTQIHNDVMALTGDNALALYVADIGGDSLSPVDDVFEYINRSFGEHITIKISDKNANPETNVLQQPKGISLGEHILDKRDGTPLTTSSIKIFRNSSFRLYTDLKWERVCFAARKLNPEDNDAKNSPYSANLVKTTTANTCFLAFDADHTIIAVKVIGTDSSGNSVSNNPNDFCVVVDVTIGNLSDGINFDELHITHDFPNSLSIKDYATKVATLGQTQFAPIY